MSNTEPPEKADNIGDALVLVSQTLGMGAAISGIPAPPVAAGFAAAAAVAGLSNLAYTRFRRRSSEVAEGVEERLGDEEAAAIQRVTRDEDAAVLSLQAVDASLLAHHREQALALGRVLGDALRDRVAIDDGAILIQALRTLDLPHFVALRALAGSVEGRKLQVTSEMLDLTPGEGPSWFAVIEDALPDADESIVHAIGAALDRAAAVSLDPAGFGGYAVTPFGQRLLDYIGD